MRYPINLNISGKICVVLGGGHVALRKVNGLLDAGGKVVLIAPEICKAVKQLVDKGQIEWQQQRYSVGCIPIGLILIAATDNQQINELAAIEAAEKHMLVNIVNSELTRNKGQGATGKFSHSAFRIPNSELFTVPSVIRRGNLTLTISTEGTSPALSKCIRKYLETQFNDNFSRWLEQLSEIRAEVKLTIKDAETRERFWRDVMSNENLYLAQNGELNKAEVNIRNALNGYRSKPQDCTN